MTTYKEIKDNTDYTCFEIPIGTYYIGDPGYVMDGEDYDKLVEFYMDECSGIFELKGKKFLIIDNGGDGGVPIYSDHEESDEEWSSIGIDHGMFAFIPLDYLTEEMGSTQESLLNSGVIMTFNWEGVDWGDDEPSAEDLETIDVDHWEMKMVEVDGYSFFMCPDAEETYLAIGK